jgi:Membrane protein involved in the export of O-antigen and teichoic acid
MSSSDPPEPGDDHRRHLRRGFNWLGGATIIAKLIDFGTIITVLFFLSKEQVGVASLVVSIGAVIESVNDVGTGPAMIQARSLSRPQLDTVFWMIIGLSLLVAAGLVLISPLFGMLYGIAGMTGYLAAIALKQPIVGAAVVSTTLLNRELKYERLAMIRVFATFAAAITRLGLAVAGAGAWALVLGFVANGVFTLIAAQIARPFWPASRFRWNAISGLMQFGVRASASNVLTQLFKNVDYLLIGWLYGPNQLAIYRVAFDLAMEPVTAVGTLINRTSMPVFSRIWDRKAELVSALKWSLGRLEVVILPVMAFFVLAADPLMGLLHDGEGHSYAGAALPLKVLAIAAMLRVTLEMVYPLILASGRPGLAVRLAATTLLLLAAGVLVIGTTVRATFGLTAVSAVWLLLYAPLLIWAARLLERDWQIHLREVAGALWLPLAAIVVLAALWVPIHFLVVSQGAWLQVAAAALVAASAYLGMYAYTRWRRAPELPS